MRKLFYIPVIHSQEDMGSMAEPLKQQYIQQFGSAKWYEHVRTVDNMWEGIAERINALQLNYRKAKVYQDGLPICGRELEIVRDVAGFGSRNYKIVLDLVTKGARLIGTEDAGLLVEEYNFVKEFTEIKDINKRRTAMKKARKHRDKLIIERDKFVAKRINETLKQDETGILFSGIEHEIDRFLPEDIKIEYIIYRLPFRKLQAGRS